MGFMTVTMFIGITIFSAVLDVRVNEHLAATSSVLSQIGETIFGRTLPFFLLQGLTAGILILAANTSYQDFPRLPAILARDRFMPSQFRNRGDRLVFSNGVVILAVAASALIVAFDANLTRLIQLNVVSVFTAFSLSQLGMVRHWWRSRDAGWRRSIVINGIGATATGIVLVIVIVTITRFSHGAWLVIAAMPVIILLFLGIHRHYDRISARLRDEYASPDPEASTAFVLRVRDLGPAPAKAVGYLRALRPTLILPVFVGSAEDHREVARRWASFAPRMGTLEPLPDAGNGIVSALRRYVRSVRAGDTGFVTVVVPEALSSRSLLQHLAVGSAFWLKARLFFEADVVMADVPSLPEERTSSGRLEHPVEPTRHVVVIPVAGVHAAPGASGVVRAVAGRRRRRGDLLLDRARRRARARRRVDGPADGGSALDRRRPVPGLLEAHARGGAPVHEPCGHGGHSRPSGTGRGALVGAPAAQPELALLQAAAAVRAERSRDERPAPPAPGGTSLGRERPLTVGANRILHDIGRRRHEALPQFGARLRMSGTSEVHC